MLNRSKMLVLIVWMLVTTSVFAIPQSINFSVTIANRQVINGDELVVPLSGAHDLTISIRRIGQDDSIPALYNTTLPGVTFSKGMAHLSIGSTLEPLPASIFNYNDLLIRVTQTSTQQYLEVALNSVPYSFQSGKANLANIATTANYALVAERANSVDWNNVINAPNLQIDVERALTANYAAISSTSNYSAFSNTANSVLWSNIVFKPDFVSDVGLNVSTSNTEIRFNLNSASALSLGGVKIASTSNITINSAGFITVDVDEVDTTLSTADVDAMVADNGYITSNLTEAQVDSFVADNGYITSNLTESEVDNFVSNNGYLTSYTTANTTTLGGVKIATTSNITINSAGFITVDVDEVDTTLSTADVDAMVADNGYITSNLTEFDVDNFVSNNGYLTSLVTANASTLGAVKIASTSNISINSAGFITVDVDEFDTTLSTADVDAMVADNGYITSNLTEAQVDSFVADNGYITSNLTESEVDNFVSNNGYLTSYTTANTTTLGGVKIATTSNITINSAGFITVDVDEVDTTLSTADVDAMVADNGYITSNLTEFEVDNFVSNNGYLTSLVTANASTLGAVKIASTSNISINSAGFITVDVDEVDTTLSTADVDAMVADNGYITSNLTEAQVDSFVADNGYITSNLTESEVDNFVSNNGYLTSYTTANTTTLGGVKIATTSNITINSAGFITVDVDEVDTTLSTADVDAMVADNGYITSNLTEFDVDNFVSNNGYLTSLVTANASTLGAVKIASTSNISINSAGFITVDVDEFDTTLSTADVDAMVADNGYITSNLTEAQVDSFVADNGYITSNLTESEVDNFVSNNGYLTSYTTANTTTLGGVKIATTSNITINSAGFITVDVDEVDTTLSTADVDAMVADNGYITSNLTEFDVDNFVSNNGYLTSLVTANASTLGAVKIASTSNISINSAGFITVDVDEVDTTLSTADVDAMVADNGYITSNLTEAQVDSFVADNGYITSNLTESEVDNFVSNNGYLTSYTTANTTTLGGVKIATTSNITINSAGFITVDVDEVDTTLSTADVDAMVADNGYITSNLTESEVDNFVSNNGYLTSYTTANTTTLGGVKIATTSNITINSAGFITVDVDEVDTTLSTADVDAMVADNGYITSNLTESEVDNFVSNNGYLTSYTTANTTTLGGVKIATTSNITINSAGFITVDVDEVDTTLSTADVDAMVADNGYITSNLTEFDVDNFVSNNGYLTSLVTANASTLGAVKIASTSNITINSAGFITVDVDEVDTTLSTADVDAMVADNGYLTSYTTANSTTLGGIKISPSSNIQIDSNGVIFGNISAPTANRTTLGGVKIASTSNISIDLNGFITVNVDDVDTVLATSTVIQMVSANSFISTVPVASTSSVGGFIVSTSSLVQIDPRTKVLDLSPVVVTSNYNGPLTVNGSARFGTVSRFIGPVDITAPLNISSHIIPQQHHVSVLGSASSSLRAAFSRDFIVTSQNGGIVFEGDISNTTNVKLQIPSDPSGNIVINLPTTSGTLLVDSNWTSYTPSITFGSGDIVDSSSFEYIEQGDLVRFIGKLEVTISGSDRNEIVFTLPSNSETEPAFSSTLVEDRTLLGGSISYFNPYVGLEDDYTNEVYVRASFTDGASYVLRVSGFYKKY